MCIRNVLKELEAHIHPITPGAGASGKSEWKHYADGTYRIKITLRAFQSPKDSDMIQGRYFKAKNAFTLSVPRQSHLG